MAAALKARYEACLRWLDDPTERTWAEYVTARDAVMVLL